MLGYLGSPQLGIALGNIATGHSFGWWELVPKPFPSFPTENPLRNDGIGRPST